MSIWFARTFDPFDEESALDVTLNDDGVSDVEADAEFEEHFEDTLGNQETPPPPHANRHPDVIPPQSDDVRSREPYPK